MSRAAWPARLSVWLCARLLIAYPAAFRHTYGAEMIQVFRDCCRDAALRAGVPGLLALWGRTAADLASSGWRERMAAAVAAPARPYEGSSPMPKQHRAERLLPYPLILLLGLGIGYLNLHTDETPFVALPLLAGAALVGFINPRAAWRWGLLLGVWPVLSALWALATHMTLPYPNTPGEIQGALIGGLLFAGVGAYLGVLGRWLVRQLLAAADTAR
jgi:hypothetical protein